MSSHSYVPPIGPRLRVLVLCLLALFALEAVNAIYLLAITVAEHLSGATVQNYFYQLVFLGHLALGALLIVPLLVFGVLHLRNAWHDPNRRALRAGLALFTTALVLVGSGVVLTRLEGVIDVRDPVVRDAAYWAHVVSPLVVIWLYVLHRLAGPPIRWRVGLRIAVAGAAVALVMVLSSGHDPRRWNVAGPAEGERYFFPSLARTATGDFIPARALMNDEYCRRCHADAHDDWSYSAHRFSSFNNPAYLFSVRETRAAALARDGDVRASRFCAGCHDPVPFFSGAFDDPKYDDERDPTSQAGITCTVCHAITNVNSPRGNADFTIEEPEHYPFAFSDSPLLRWVNEQLVKAKPALHKRTFLKPLHRTPEFCSTCHKVHLPEELNKYRWLRGQNHYDSFHLSGVSGHGVTSFYYPPKAEHSCNGCHMPARSSTDFGARVLDDTGELKIHGHRFPSANTALPHLLDWNREIIAEHERFNEGALRVDVFGVRDGGVIDGELTAPLRPEVPALRPGGTYLLEVVIRTLKLGHLFTQGTVDSNEVWLDVTLRSGDRVIGRSGGRRADGAVDPWSHFVNAYVLDREGRRIDRRNAQDIFVALYNHQIPPGAADVVHYRFTVPEELDAPLVAEVALRYRKFDTIYMQHVYGADFVNDLPVMTLATDQVTLRVAGIADDVPVAAAPAPAWERWNDYGIGLLRKGDSGADKGQLRQAERAFQEVEALGRPEGPLHRARTYLKEGRLDDAVAALGAAAAHDPPARPWSVAWFTGLVNRQNGHLAAALESFLSLAETRFPDARRRGFDFGQDYRLLAMLGRTCFDLAKLERGAARRAAREQRLGEARDWYRRALAIDPENVTAHHGLAQVLATLGDEAGAARHRALHAKYKPDDNARDAVIARHRAANPAADHAADAIVVYDLQREGAYELGR